MKVYFYRKVYKRRYYFKANAITTFDKRITWYGNKMTPEIMHKDEEMEPTLIIGEHEALTREVQIGDKIKVGQYEYKIIDKSYNLDGTINYYIDDNHVIEDHESKIKAYEECVKHLKEEVSELESDNKKLKN